jgi:proteasome accessory factor A
MHHWLVGVETEYGLSVENRDASDQVNDAIDFVRSYSGLGFRGWNYKHENPQNDLRGFVLDHLETDPNDARFDKPQTVCERDLRSDWIMPNGARFYNDHGHPEYATPECWSAREAALQDKAGEKILLSIEEDYLQKCGRKARLYKNNTDFHGASYGTHESYLAPRQIGFERVYQMVGPMLVARTLLCGAGKVGSEAGASVQYQLSQRADFLVEDSSAETLYHRPVFNTRDEPHAEASRWMRLHVISGDANRIVSTTARKLALVKLAIDLADSGIPSLVHLKNLPRALSQVSRNPDAALDTDHTKTTAEEILRLYIDAARQNLDLDTETIEIIQECETLLDCRIANPGQFAMHVDWAIKKMMLEEFMTDEGISWGDPRLRSFDLEYHNIDPVESLYDALVELGRVAPDPKAAEIAKRIDHPQEFNRSCVRSIAIKQHQEHLVSACWKTLTFELDGQAVEVDLDPERRYSSRLGASTSVESFIETLRDNT